MFGRTMMLIAVLIAVGHYTWVSVSEKLEAPERAYWAAHEAVSIVNLTRAALLASHASRRLMLLAELSQSESIQLYPLEMLPMEANVRYSPLQRNIVEELRKELGPQTLVGFDRHGINGLWVSFEMAADRYWLVIPRAPTREDRSLAWVGWSALVLLLSMVGAGIIVRRVTQPLADLASAAQRLATGDKPERIDEHGPKELATVTRAFNRMSRNLERADTDRAMLLAGVSHDLRTPLTRLRLGVEMLPDNVDDQSRKGMIEDIEDINATIGQFLNFVRDERSEVPVEIDPAQLLGTLAARYREREVDVSVDTTLAPQGALLRPLATRRMLQNLVDNAIRYGRPPINLVARQAGNQLVLEVLDRGEGIPPEAVERMLQPFTRLDMARGGGGTGLGLAIVDRIAQMHGGQLELLPREGGGLLARVWLPLTAA
ncbi:MAG: HAMP domain-containing protein [Betaproteobacteria bacterium]|jgi:two-component system osmolarity sensor histidine kinase EnvZ|nr:HAMP domain-containing protein [Betaproteobacteria bacterium]